MKKVTKIRFLLFPGGLGLAEVVREGGSTRLYHLQGGAAHWIVRWAEKNGDVVGYVPVDSLLITVKRNGA